MLAVGSALYLPWKNGSCWVLFSKLMAWPCHVNPGFKLKLPGWNWAHLPRGCHAKNEAQAAPERRESHMLLHRTANRFRRQFENASHNSSCPAIQVPNSTISVFAQNPRTAPGLSNHPGLCCSDAASPDLRRQPVQFMQTRADEHRVR